MLIAKSIGRVLTGGAFCPSLNKGADRRTEHTLHKSKMTECPAGGNNYLRQQTPYGDLEPIHDAANTGQNALFKEVFRVFTDQ